MNRRPNQPPSPKVVQMASQLAQVASAYSTAPLGGRRLYSVSVDALAGADV